MLAQVKGFQHLTKTENFSAPYLSLGVMACANRIAAHLAQMTTLNATLGRQNIPFRHPSKRMQSSNQKFFSAFNSITTFNICLENEQMEYLCASFFKQNL